MPALADLSLTDLVPVPSNINAGLQCPSAADLTALLGKPRESYGTTCQPISNSALAARVVTASVGLFRVTGFGPAVSSLREVMLDIAREHPAVHRVLGTAGMLCCRLQRGSTRVSSHSWGTAVDLTLEGQLDVRGNNKVQYGLTLIAPIFNRHGWYWGAAFRTEDAMHFEAGKTLIQRWTGITPVVQPPKEPLPTPLKRGDNRPAVKRLQETLNKFGATLRADGDFGTRTEAAVRRFQASHRLNPDGIVGRLTAKALGL